MFLNHHPTPTEMDESALLNARKSRDLVVNLLSFIYSPMNRVASLQKECLPIFFDSQSFFWPGNRELGWRPALPLLRTVAQKATLETKEALRTAKNDSLSLNTPDKAQVSLNAELCHIVGRVFLPASRVSVFATPRADLSVGAFVLQFIGAEEDLGAIGRIALDLSHELKERDPTRLLQMHLEVLLNADDLSEEVASGLFQSLGNPRNSQIVTKLGGSVLRMVKRGMMESMQKQKPYVLRLLIPYLDFVGKDAMGKLAQIWNDLVNAEKESNVEFKTAWEEGSLKDALMFHSRLNGNRQPEAPNKKKRKPQPVEKTSAKKTKAIQPLKMVSVG